MRSRWVLIGGLAVLVLALGAAGWWLDRTLEESRRAKVADTLRANLESDRDLLAAWLDDRREAAELLAQDAQVRAAVAEVARSAVANPDRDSLLTDRHLVHLRTLLRPACVKHGYLGFFVTARNGRVIAALYDDPVGLVAEPEARPALADAWAGKAHLTHPYLSPWRQPAPPYGELLVGQPAMVAAAPVRDDAGAVVAALAFRLRIDVEFARVCQQSRWGKSGETYTFDAAGRMLSPTRFEDEAVRSFLPSSVPGLPGATVLEIRDPGGNVLDGFHSKLARQDQPLTRMAAAAVAGESGMDLDGYRDYRGVRVVGAWDWVEPYGFGIGAEVDEAEAYRPLRRLRVVMRVLFGGLCAFALGAASMAAVAARYRRRAADARLIARRLGQYLLEGRLGQGGMGVVYRAQHALLRRPTAVKVMHPDRAGPDELAHFEREVQATCRLAHPNTIVVYDYGRSDDGTFYYAMEFLDGLNLQQAVAAGGPMPEGRVIHVLRQVCESLAEAHAAGLIHRDIKPSNVMLTQRGLAFDFAKVLDFGLVLESGPGGAAPVERVGTPEYMAPEQIRPDGRVDARTDLYALGAVGYFLLTGQPVFSGRDPQSVLNHHLNTPPTPPAQRSPRPIAADLEQVVLRCLAKDPAARPASAEALRNDLLLCAAAEVWTAADARVWWDAHGETGPAPSGPTDRVPMGSSDFVLTVDLGRRTRRDPDRPS